MTATTTRPAPSGADTDQPRAERGAHTEEDGQELETLVILRPVTMEAQAWQTLGVAVDELLAGDSVATIARALANAALTDRDVGDLLGAACTEAARLLPKGMPLTHARPGSWESEHVDALTDPAAVDEGPGAAPLDIDCDRCGAPPGSGCWNPATYADNKHPHRERVALARGAVFSPGSGWWSL